jgi:pimeloyl-ACP methyl ester carboxylesterase
MPNAVVTYNEQKTSTGIFCRKTSTPTSKDALVLIMGYGGSLRVWPVEFVEKLAQKYVVITYDNRGTGLSILPEEASSYTIKAMADDLDEVMKTLQVQQAHILGYSMGSCIALQYAHDYAEKVKSLFLLCGTAGGALYVKPDPQLSAALANPQGETLWDMYMSTWSLMYSPEKMSLCHASLAAVFEYSKELPTRPIGLLGHSYAFKGFNAETYLAKLKMPTTVMAGENDRLMPLDNSKNLADNIPGAKLVVIPDCEHCPHVQDEELVIAEIDALTQR